MNALQSLSYNGRNERWRHNGHVMGANGSTIGLNANCSIGRSTESPA